MKKILKIIIIAIILLCTFMAGKFYWSPGINAPIDAELLPTKVIFQQQSPNKEITAEILEGQTIEGNDLLGPNKRFYLALKYDNARHLVIRDLSEGFGTYEGGVLGVKWLDNHQVCIERAVGDQRADLIYDLSNHTWQNVKTK